jgi:uncharacterized protein YciI
MNHFVLIYDVIDDYVARRAAFREEHLGYSRAAQARGELLLGGVFTDPVDKALLIFRVKDAAVVEEFARHDPYVLNGLVKNWTVRPWTVAIGNQP